MSDQASDQVAKEEASAEHPDLTAQRAELTVLISTISMRSAGDVSTLLGTLLSYVPIHEWADLETDLRREFGFAPRSSVPTETTG